MNHDPPPQRIDAPPLPHLTGASPRPRSLYWGWAGIWLSLLGWAASIWGTVLALRDANQVSVGLSFVAGFTVCFIGLICGLMGRKHIAGKIAIGTGALQIVMFLGLMLIGMTVGDS